MKKRRRPPLPIIYEDERIIVIDKPAGLLTTATRLPGRAARASQVTAENLLGDYLRKGQVKSTRRAWLVHRLDRETSGVMVFAKTAEIADAFRSDWHELSRKTYLAQVAGTPEPATGEFASFLREDDDGYRVRVVGEHVPGARFAHTRYRTLAVKGGVATVEVMLETGRKNQIRVHFAAAGYPIVGDVKYGGPPARRLMLHAAQLQLRNDRNSPWQTFTAPVPSGFGV